MTVIAGVQADGNVVMGCDTAWYIDGTAIYAADDKIARIGNGGGDSVLIGAAGLGSIVPTLKRRLRFDGDLAIPAPHRTTTDVDQWAQDVAERITGILADASPSFLHTADSSRAAAFDGILLLGWHRHLWIVSTHCALKPRNGVAAIGSGADIALGAIHAALPRGASAEDAVRQAVILAADFDPHCGLDDRGPLLRHTSV